MCATRERRPRPAGTASGQVAEVAAIGRLTDTPDAPWFGVGRVGRDRGYRLVFGEPRSRDVVIDRAEPAARRHVLLALAAFFEAEAAPPPPDLEATQSDVADALRWLVASTADEGEARALRRALDAIDDGLPPDAVVAELYTAMGAAPLEEEPRPGVGTLDELRGLYGPRGNGA
ncbi:MAG: hypothetical protein M3295_10635 [Chloroflexota bacterium]|nr:hypothetical protein [Chloroflexota bacterium]